MEMSEVIVAGNECSLGSIWLRTSAYIDGDRSRLARGTRTPGSAAGQRSS